MSRPGHGTGSSRRGMGWARVAISAYGTGPGFLFPYSGRDREIAGRDGISRARQDWCVGDIYIYSIATMASLSPIYILTGPGIVGWDGISRDRPGPAGIGDCKDFAKYGVHCCWSCNMI